MCVSYIVNFLIQDEVRSQRIQREYFKPLPTVSAAATIIDDIIPKAIYMAKPDPSKLLRVYYELGEGKAYLHLVTDDEYFPIKAIDDEYRKERCKEFGRTADVESVELFFGGDTWIANFVTTFVGINVYETSVHFNGRQAYKGALYTDTWNHLMSCSPSPAVALRYGFKKVDLSTVEFIPGTRHDAEEYGKKISKC